jgi:iron complex transport system substrate-binding protein
MKRLLMFSLIIIFIFALPAAAQEGEWPRTLVDAQGTEVTIAAPPQRVASLSLAADETLLPILQPARFAAVTALSQDPGISNVAVLADQVPNAIVSSDDTEQIIALEPDLVIAASFTAPETIQQLRDAGLTVFTTDYAVGLDAVRANIRLLGQVVGEEAAAEAQVARMDAEIANVTATVGGRAEVPVGVLYLTPGNYTSGANSTIAEIITLAGGVDVSAEAGLDQFAAVSDEFIITANPGVILLTGWTPYDPTFVDTFMNNPAFTGLSAIQNQRVYVANDAHLTSVSQYVSEGVKDVAAYLWPDAYPGYPMLLTDAAGNQLSIGAAPNSVVALGEGNAEALNRLLGVLGEPGFDVIEFNAEDSAINAAGNVIVFAPVPQAELPPVSGASSVTYVQLYEGNTPAEVIENIELMGDALGDRIAALNAIAAYTDELESIPAG